jgi:hypothetical protein
VAWAKTGPTTDEDREPIILTGSKDTNMLLGELDAQDYA